MHRFYIPEPQVDGDTVIIKDGSRIHQMSKVLRMKTGSVFSVFDENGKEFSVLIEEINRKKVIGKKKDDIKRETESKLEVSLYQAIPKKTDLFELIVQKATEIGVTQIFPVITERTEKRRLSKFERLQRIAIEATEQSNRTKVPVIRHPVDLIDALPKMSNAYLGYELEKTKNIFEYLPEIKKAKELQLIIGPEGGLSHKEIEAAQKAKVNVFTMGPRILRTETAAISALSIMLLNK